MCGAMASSLPPEQGQCLSVLGHVPITPGLDRVLLGRLHLTDKDAGSERQRLLPRTTQLRTEGHRQARRPEAEPQAWIEDVGPLAMGGERPQRTRCGALYDLGLFHLPAGLRFLPSPRQPHSSQGRCRGQGVLLTLPFLPSARGC